MFYFTMKSKFVTHTHRSMKIDMRLDGEEREKFPSRERKAQYYFLPHAESIHMHVYV